VFDLQAQLMRKHMDIEEIAKLAQVNFMAEDPQALQQAMQLIKNPEFVLRARVESDTLSDIDFQAEKQDRMEYMMTITNFLKETIPMIQQDQVMGPFLMQLLQFSLAGFKIGKKFEGELDRTFQQIQQKMQNPEPPKPTPEEQKVQGQLQLMQQKGQLDAQSKQQDNAAQQQENSQNLQFKQQEQQLKLVGKQQDLAVKTQANQQKMEQSKAQFWQNLMHDRIKAEQQQENAPAKPPYVPSGVGHG
jgi:hypothetical protein